MRALVRGLCDRASKMIPDRGACSIQRGRKMLMDGGAHRIQWGSVLSQDCCTLRILQRSITRMRALVRGLCDRASKIIPDRGACSIQRGRKMLLDGGAHCIQWGSVLSQDCCALRILQRSITPMLTLVRSLHNRASKMIPDRGACSIQGKKDAAGRRCSSYPKG
jgi:hypothetical protein